MFSAIYTIKLFYPSSIQDLATIPYFQSCGMSTSTDSQMIDAYADMFSDGYGTYKTWNDGSSLHHV